MAELFSWALGRHVSWQAAAACYPERGEGPKFDVDSAALTRLGGCRRRVVEGDAILGVDSMPMDWEGLCS